MKYHFPLKNFTEKNLNKKEEKTNYQIRIDAFCLLGIGWDSVYILFLFFF